MAYNRFYCLLLFYGCSVVGVLCISWFLLKSMLKKLKSLGRGGDFMLQSDTDVMIVEDLRGRLRINTVWIVLGWLMVILLLVCGRTEIFNSVSEYREYESWGTVEVTVLSTRQEWLLMDNKAVKYTICSVEYVVDGKEYKSELRLNAKVDDRVMVYYNPKKPKELCENISYDFRWGILSVLVGICVLGYYIAKGYRQRSHLRERLRLVQSGVFDV